MSSSRTSPVVLTRIDGHAVLANSAALKIAGITGKTRIDGGKILLRDGKPNGILLDNAADMIKALVPAPDNQAKRKSLEEAQYECFKFGLTSVLTQGCIIVTSY
jgi:predicted amidohydrolase YtcJ